jgi:restriction system protein
MGPRSTTPYDLISLPVSEIPVIERVKRLSWPDFEQFVAEVYRRQGFHVEHTGGTQPDGGYDLVLLRDKASLLVQCKHWLAYQVGVPRVRELFGAMHKVGATGGILVTTGIFTGPAKQFAKGMPLQLVDGEALVKLLTRATQPDEEPVAAAGGPPECPKCGKRMVWRTAEKGRHLGERFWGCSSYPRCRGIRQAA